LNLPLTNIDRVQAKKLNRLDFVKQGSKNFKSGKENHLFDNCFEIVLRNETVHENQYESITRWRIVTKDTTIENVLSP